MYPLCTGVPCTVFARVPDKYRRLVKNAWAEANRGGDPVDCFLEGPSFDRAGNLLLRSRSGRRNTLAHAEGPGVYKGTERPPCT
jgi:hypothetical protein